MGVFVAVCVAVGGGLVAVCVAVGGSLVGVFVAVCVAVGGGLVGVAVGGLVGTGVDSGTSVAVGVFLGVFVGTSVGTEEAVFVAVADCPDDGTVALGVAVLGGRVSVSSGGLGVDVGGGSVGVTWKAPGWPSPGTDEFVLTAVGVTVGTAVSKLARTFSKRSTTLVGSWSLMTASMISIFKPGLGAEI